MFQDEARFGRMVRIRRCWAQAPARPMVDNGYEREFTYVYGKIRVSVQILTKLLFTRLSRHTTKSAEKIRVSGKKYGSVKNTGQCANLDKYGSVSKS